MEKEKIDIRSKDGQALIEFVLLIAIIFTTSFVALRGINTRIADLWVEAVRSIVADPNEEGKITL